MEWPISDGQEIGIARLELRNPAFVLIARHPTPAAEEDAPDAQPHAGARIAADGETEGRSSEAARNRRAANPRPTLDNLPALPDKQHGRW
jgi:hypothetical protein